MILASHAKDEVRTGNRGIAAFLAAYLPLFSPYFLGLIAVRVWLQCSIYDRYLSTDSGFITIVSNFVRAAFIAIILALVIMNGFPPLAKRILTAASTAAMTAASVLFLLELETGAVWMMWPACLLAGFGIIWGGGVWMQFYERLVPGEALFCAFVSLAGSCIIGFFLGLIPENVTHLIAILMPITSLLAYRRAMSALDARERVRQKAGDAVGLVLENAFGPSQPPSDRYDSEPWSTFVRLIIGVALFNLALGLARGFPHGDAIALPVELQAVHQFGACALSIAVVWRGLAGKRGVRFSTLWIVSISFIIAGVLLLSFANEGLMPVGAACISIANTFTLGVLWYCSYDLGRHLSMPTYVVLGVAWAAHLLPREIGRSLIWIVGPSDQVTLLVMVSMVVLIAVSIAFIMNDSIPVTRKFFADLRTPDVRIDVDVACSGEDDFAAMHESPSRRPDDKETPVCDPYERLRERYFLTDREVDVARLMAQGRSKAAIAERLYLSENTVRTHARNLYAKLDIHNRQELLDAIESARAEE